MGYNVSGVLDAIDILVSNSIQKAGYDKTIVAKIIDCINAETKTYNLQYQNSIFTAIAQNVSEYYKKDDLVYVMKPSNDPVLTGYIIGKVSQSVIDAIDASQREYDKYSSLGNVSFSDSLGTLEKDRLDFDDSIDWEQLKTGFMASPYFVVEMDVESQVIEEAPSGNYGIRLNFEFEGGRTRTYTFDINKMSGQPYNYSTPSHQYAIFTIEDASSFQKINSIEFFSQGFDENDKFKISNIICFAATKSGEVISKYSLEISANKSYLWNEKDKIKLTAQMKISGEDFDSSQIKYYWFTEDLTINAGSNPQGYFNIPYNKWGGEGWRCINDTIDIEPIDAALLYSPSTNTKSIIIDKNKASLYHNVFKCIVIYNNVQVESQEFEVLYYDAEYKPNIKLISKIHTGDSEPNENTWSENIYLEKDDYSKIIAEVDNYNNVSYIWQAIDTEDNRVFLDSNINEVIYYAKNIYNNVTIKCGVLLDNKYIGKETITLYSLDTELREKMVSLKNTFNAITNNGMYEGIFYTDEDGNKITDLNNFDKENGQLIINASFIRTGALEVGYTEKDENGNIKEHLIFSANVGDSIVKIGGFNVSSYNIFKDLKEKTTDEYNPEEIERPLSEFENGVYLGTDGLFIGNRNNSYIKAEYKNNDWNLDIKGKVTANTGEIGGFIIEEKLLHSKNNLINISGDNDYAIWAGNENAETPEDAYFYVKQDGSLKATLANISGFIKAENGTIGKFIITKDGELLGGDPFISFDNNGNIIDRDRSKINFVINSNSAKSDENEIEDVLYLGGSTPESASFKVDNTGKMTANAGEIAGISFSLDEDNKIYSFGNKEQGFLLQTNIDKDINNYERSILYINKINSNTHKNFIQLNDTETSDVLGIRFNRLIRGNNNAIYTAIDQNGASIVGTRTINPGYHIDATEWNGILSTNTLFLQIYFYDENEKILKANNILNKGLTYNFIINIKADIVTSSGAIVETKGNKDFQLIFSGANTNSYDFNIEITKIFRQFYKNTTFINGSTLPRLTFSIVGHTPSSTTKIENSDSGNKYEQTIFYFNDLIMTAPMYFNGNLFPAESLQTGVLGTVEGYCIGSPQNMWKSIYVDTIYYKNMVQI